MPKTSKIAFLATLSGICLASGVIAPTLAFAAPAPAPAPAAGAPAAAAPAAAAPAAASVDQNEVSGVSLTVINNTASQLKVDGQTIAPGGSSATKTDKNWAGGQVLSNIAYDKGVTTQIGANNSLCGNPAFLWMNSMTRFNNDGGHHTVTTSYAGTFDVTMTAGGGYKTFVAKITQQPS